MKTHTIEIKDIFYFHKLQEELLGVFFNNYKDVNDFEKLMDFPWKGELQLVDRSLWSFTKHGIGIRFKKMNSKPNICINVHTHVKMNNLITVWRLSNYFSSLGREVTDDDIKLLLHDMESQGMISKISGGYILN